MVIDKPPLEAFLVRGEVSSRCLSQLKIIRSWCDLPLISYGLTNGAIWLLAGTCGYKETGWDTQSWCWKVISQRKQFRLLRRVMLGID